MADDVTRNGYIHSFSAAERRRLIEQAEYLAPLHHAGLDLTGCAEVLEVGCGVGAQIRIVLRTWPEAAVTGIDCNPDQIAAARQMLRDDVAVGRVRLHCAAAEALPLPDESFDAAYVFWMFEHMPEPLPALHEMVRVLRPGGRVYLTEVFDRAVYACPPSPCFEAYFKAFMQLQSALGGDPDVGIRLGGLAAAAGLAEIELRDVSPLLDARLRDPNARARFTSYFESLLLSGADQLLSRGKVDPATVSGMQSEFATIRDNPESVFHYGARQLAARKPAASGQG